MSPVVHQSVTEVHMLMADEFPEHCCDLKAVQRCRDGDVGRKSGWDVGLLTIGATRAASALGASHMGSLGSTYLPDTWQRPSSSS